MVMGTQRSQCNYNPTVVPLMVKEEHFTLCTYDNKQSIESLNKIKWII